MTGWQGAIRQAEFGDVDAVADLAAALAMSFEFSAARFRQNYQSLLAEEDACLLLAVDGHESVGYLLFPQDTERFAGGPNRRRDSAVPASHVSQGEHSGHFGRAARRCLAR